MKPVRKEESDGQLSNLGRRWNYRTTSTRAVDVPAPNANIHKLAAHGKPAGFGVEHAGRWQQYSSTGPDYEKCCYAGQATRPTLRVHVLVNSVWFAFSPEIVGLDLN
jgi:hypothetical protein